MEVNVTEEKATAEQTPESTPEETPQTDQQEGVKEEAAGAAEERMKGLETQLQELEQRNSARDIQHKAELERLTRESSVETERRVTQAVQTTKTELAGQKREVEIAQLRSR